MSNPAENIMPQNLNDNCSPFSLREFTYFYVFALQIDTRVFEMGITLHNCVTLFGSTDVRSISVNAASQGFSGFHCAPSPVICTDSGNMNWSFVGCCSLVSDKHQSYPLCWLKNTSTTTTTTTRTTAAATETTTTITTTTATTTNNSQTMNVQE